MDEDNNKKCKLLRDNILDKLEKILDNIEVEVKEKTNKVVGKES